MAPNATVEATGVLNEVDAETIDGGLSKDITTLKRAEKRKIKLVWRNVIAFGYLHLAAVYGLWLLLTSARLYTVAFGKFPIFNKRVDRMSNVHAQKSYTCLAKF